MVAKSEDRTLALCRIARRLSRSRSRDERAMHYISGAISLAGARRVAVLWLRRREVRIAECAAGGDLTRRAYPIATDNYDAFTPMRALPEGRLAPGTLPALPLPPGFSSSAEVVLLLPEGRSHVAPRLVIEGARPDALDDYRALLAMLRPHWIARRALRRRASIDHLTGVFNYRHLRRYMTHTCRAARHGRSRFSILMLDLDHLREYNAEFGHLMGSRVLAQLGNVLRTSLRGADLVAKYGGDEFIAVLPGCSKANAVEVALRLNEHISRQSFYGVSSGYITCSIGVATFGEDGTSYQSLVGAADRAIFSAKDRGRNTVVAAGGEKTRDFRRADR